MKMSSTSKLDSISRIPRVSLTSPFFFVPPFPLLKFLLLILVWEKENKEWKGKWKKVF